MLGVFICFPFDFVLSQNNLKRISTWLPEKWRTLILCRGNARLTCAAKKKKTGHIPEWKTNALQNMSKIFMIVSSSCCFNFTFLNAENVGLQNTPKAR